MGEAMGAVLNWSASFLWSIGSSLARRFSRPGVRVDARVISVGNIQVGGAGKTPLVAELARQAQDRGLSVCILCRGYGARWESGGGVLAPKSSGVPEPTASECGDEAALLHDLAPDAWIGVGAERVAQFEGVKRKAGKIDLVILDDGFQNHQFKKDLEIVAITSARRTERIFRDFRGALKAAGLVVWTKGQTAPDGFDRPRARVRFGLPRSTGGAPLFLVSGVADAGSVFETAIQAGHLIGKHVSFPDHARYAEGVVRSLVDEARKAGMRIAVTGKDWVKWRGWVKDSDVEVLEPQVLLDPEDKKVWNRVVWGE